MIEHLKSSEWWISVVIVGLIISLLANFIYTIVTKFLSKRSIKLKAKQEKSLKSEADIIKYYSTDFNLLVIRKLWGLNTHMYIIFVLCLSNLIVCYSIFFGLNSFNENTYLFIFLSVVLLFILVYLLRKNNLELKRIYEASLNFINVNTLGKYFPGKWQLTYSKQNFKEKEIVEIKEGNKYYCDGKLGFIILNFQVNIDTNQISFEKHNLQGNLHSKESLKIENDRLLTGKDNIGFDLIYERID